MNKLYKIPFYTIGYKLYKCLGLPRLLPISLTLSVTERCNSMCKTCNLWKTPSEKELSVEEWKKIFEKLGDSTAWLTFSGGDQFLRDDFYEIVNHAIELTRPCLINIPLSNIDVNGTVKQVTKILEHSNTPLVINISLDGVEEAHNFLRGRKDSFQATIELFKQLKNLKKPFPQLSVCFNTVVSSYNIDSLDEVYKLVSDLQPDYWMAEPFQCRAEFKNLGENPGLDYKKFFLKLKSFNLGEKSRFNGVLKVKHIIRQAYYHFVEKTFPENKSMMPCYASISSVRISPQGNVWQCGTKGDILGSLRESDYDLKKILFSKKAGLVRKDIKEKKCSCIQCNAFYTNLLCNPRYFIKYFFAKLKRLIRFQ
ncbi:MAG: radical SAM protein [Nanoarchaeota archaeon]|nr:radical SAM protein [Nanoarchaeota archaeon]